MNRLKNKISIYLLTNLMLRAILRHFDEQFLPVVCGIVEMTGATINPHTINSRIGSSKYFCSGLVCIKFVSFRELHVQQQADLNRFNLNHLMCSCGVIIHQF